jgi:hypothetical protein
LRNGPVDDGWWMEGGGHAYTSPPFYPATRQELGFTEGSCISNPAESRQEAAKDPAGEVRLALLNCEQRPVKSQIWREARFQNPSGIGLPAAACAIGKGRSVDLSPLIRRACFG